MFMKVYNKAILPTGFKANGVACGIKKSGQPDLALFYSELPAKAAVVSTTNKIQAAPVQVNRRYVKKDGVYRGIIVNSGNANAFTGQSGIKDAECMSEAAADALAVKKESVLVASTGIIGRGLPVDKITKAIPRLVEGLSGQGIARAQKAIMTTDKFAKQVTLVCTIGNKAVTICGVAKGAGMIAPHMATMLVFILTDAVISQEALSGALKMAVDDSFNCITVDGCMSTNDTVILLANQAAGNEAVNSGKPFALFAKALTAVCLDLAKLVVRDGEGATKFIRIKVSQAQSRREAKKIALQIANSNLFKTAMFASSENVRGRIVASVGASGVRVKENKLKIKYSPLGKKEVDIDVSVGRGKESAVMYTSDLSYEYVKINAEYN
jgi:glutamate N-acetyltransferase/amino-acid N-acetyltransferase